MIGDQDDILRRLKAALPPWFGDETPILDALLSGPANVLTQAYAQIQYTRLQTRIGTATEGWLDLIARDFFGLYLQRRIGEDDGLYRQRIKLELFRPRATRRALSDAIRDLTGVAPKIFEPARIADTGAISRGTESTNSLVLFDGIAVSNTGSMSTTMPVAPTFAFNAAGAWGSLNYPDQFLITCYRPIGAGIPNTGGWSTFVRLLVTCDEIDVTCDKVNILCDGLRFGAGGTHIDSTMIKVDTTGTTVDSTGLNIIAVGVVGMPGGLNVGSLQWGSLAQIIGLVTDADIYRVIDRTIAAGVTAWTKIVPYDGASPTNMISWAPVLLGDEIDERTRPIDVPPHLTVPII